MKSHTTERFREAFGRLPPTVQQRAHAAYRLFGGDPSHPSLRFKRVHASRPIYSVRIGLGYRALRVRDKDVVIRFWIGSHAAYNRLLQDVGGAL